MNKRAVDLTGNIVLSTVIDTVLDLYKTAVNLPV